MPCFRRQIVPRRLMETGKPQRRVCLLLPLLLGTSGANNPNDLRIAAGPQRSFSRRRKSTANGLVVRGSSVRRMVSSTSAAFLENLRGFLPNRPSRCHHAPVLSRPLLQHRTGGSWAARRLRAGNQGISRARAWGGNDLITPAPEFGFPGLQPGDRWCVEGRWGLKSQARGSHKPEILVCATQASGTTPGFQQPENN